MRKGVFDLEDIAEQFGQIHKIGDMAGLMGMLPGVGKVKKQIDRSASTTVFTRQMAIICR